jgi:ribonuclease BN (tRNA processing enzyme)
MRVVTVGTGTAAPAAGRVQSGVIVETSDVRLLMDCGSGVASRMASIGYRWQDITHVAITHFHADHTLDVPTLIFAWRYGMLPRREAPVTLVGPVGLVSWLERCAALVDPDLMKPPPLITVLEVASGGEVTLGDGVALEARKVPHTDESVAYSVSGSGRRVVFTGDTGFNPDLGAWAAGCDLFLSECSLPDSLALPNHLTPRQCGALAAIARPRLLALTHFYPPVEQVDIAGEVAEAFDGAMVRCVDGWEITLEAT